MAPTLEGAGAPTAPPPPPNAPGHSQEAPVPLPSSTGKDKELDLAMPCQRMVHPSHVTHRHRGISQSLALGVVWGLSSVWLGGKCDLMARRVTAPQSPPSFFQNTFPHRLGTSNACHPPPVVCLTTFCCGECPRVESRVMSRSAASAHRRLLGHIRQPPLPQKHE